MTTNNMTYWNIFYELQFPSSKSMEDKWFNSPWRIIFLSRLYHHSTNTVFLRHIRIVGSHFTSKHPRVRQPSTREVHEPQRLLGSSCLTCMLAVMRIGHALDNQRSVLWNQSTVVSVQLQRVSVSDLQFRVFSFAQLFLLTNCRLKFADGYVQSVELDRVRRGRRLELVMNRHFELFTQTLPSIAYLLSQHVEVVEKTANAALSIFQPCLLTANVKKDGNSLSNIPIRFLHLPNNPDQQ